ncbi:hypothetical protein JW992_08515 [candidate division KSB1 bacterium]|nr:hypothetical protein [candidate division KSB1 bacterium]
MLLPNLVQPRRFDYQPRFYRPEQEDGKRIHFHRIRHSEVPKGGAITRLLILFVVLTAIFFYLQRNLTGSAVYSSDSSAAPIQIEEIIVVD